MKRVTVMFCCNDDRGDFAGRVSEISIEDDIRIAGPSRVMRVAPNSVKVGRLWYPCGGFMPWTGNIYWDSTGMALDTAVLLVASLLNSGWGVEEFSDGSPFTKIARRGP